MATATRGEGWRRQCVEKARDGNAWRRLATAMRGEQTRRDRRGSMGGGCTDRMRVDVCNGYALPLCAVQYHLDGAHAPEVLADEAVPRVLHVYRGLLGERLDAAGAREHVDHPALERAHAARDPPRKVARVAEELVAVGVDEPCVIGQSRDALVDARHLVRVAEGALVHNDIGRRHVPRARARDEGLGAVVRAAKATELPRVNVDERVIRPHAEMAKVMLLERWCEHTGRYRVSA